MTMIGSKCYSCFVGEHGCKGPDCACVHCSPDYEDYFEECHYCGEVYETHEEAYKCGCKESEKQRRIDFECDMADAKRKGEY